MSSKSSVGLNAEFGTKMNNTTTGIGGRDACHVRNKASSDIELISFAPAPGDKILISYKGGSILLDADDWIQISEWLKSWGYII